VPENHPFSEGRALRNRGYGRFPFLAHDRSRTHFTSILFPALLLLLTLTLTPGCKLAQGVADLPGDAVRAMGPREKELQKVDIAALQSDLMRFGDEFIAGLTLATEHLERNGQPLPPQDQLAMKLAYSGEVWSIATEANALSSLLDMVAVVTATRMGLETYWVPEVYGLSGQPLLEACLSSETNIWQIAGRVLQPLEIDELMAAVVAWHGQPRDPRASLYLRTGNLFSATTQAHAVRATPGERRGLLGIVSLDPLAGLDPATRELTKTRLFAERATYLMRRMPWMIRWQAELLGFHLAELPEVQNVITNSTSLTESAERLTRTAQELPALFQEERRILLDALDTQGTKLTALAGQVDQTLLTGSTLVSNVNTTLTTFDKVVARLEPGDPEPGAPPREPFRIQDYTETARQLDATAQRLTELLETIDQTLGSTNLARVPEQADVLLKQAKTDGQTLVDYAFARLLLLAGSVCLMIVATTLVLRFIRPRP